MMRHTHDAPSTDPGDRDPRMEEWLSLADPAEGRPGYWASFHRNVMEAARFELARRRRLADLTVAGTVTSWARTVVPSAVLTAAAAAVILLLVPPPATVAEVDLSVEELLSVGLEGDPIPAELDEEGAMSVTLVAGEIF